MNEKLNSFIKKLNEEENNNNNEYCFYQKVEEFEKFKNNLKNFGYFQNLYLLNHALMI